MKRARKAYRQENEERCKSVVDFIQSLRFSIPLHRLREQSDRKPCPKCGRRRQYYCYDCLIVVHPECQPPPLKLPLNVYVLLHPGESRGKSTSLAAATISPDLRIINYPDVPGGLEQEATLLLYPSAQSTELENVENLELYKNVIFIDGTWQQSKAMARDERLGRFKHVRIKAQTSLFWRFQNNDPTYLATVEAIYYFLREFSVQKNKREAGSQPPYYSGEVDDILYYYVNQYIAVQQHYCRSGLEYTTRHFDSYVIRCFPWDELVAKPPEIIAGGSVESS